MTCAAIVFSRSNDRSWYISCNVINVGVASTTLEVAQLNYF